MNTESPSDSEDPDNLNESCRIYYKISFMTFKVALNMKHSVLMSILALAFVIGPHMLPRASDHTHCEKPTLNTAIFADIYRQDYGACALLSTVCADEGMLVTFDTKHIGDSLLRRSSYGDMASRSGLWCDRTENATC